MSDDQKKPVSPNTIVMDSYDRVMFKHIASLSKDVWFELSQVVGRDSNRLKLISRYLRMKPVLARMARAQEKLSKERARAERSNSQRANKPKRKAVQNG